MKSLDLSNKKINTVVACVLLAIAVTITVIMGVQFSDFRNYDAEFVLRNNVIDHVYKFSEFSPQLAGTVGDSDIFTIIGTDNSVALVSVDNKDSLNTVEDIIIADSTVAVSGSTQLTIAQQKLGNGVVALADIESAVEAVANGASRVAILRHEDAKLAVSQSNGQLAISEAEIEKVPSILVIGGTHPNEPSGQLASVVFLENAVIQRGVMYVITELNRSAYSHSHPQEASPWYYEMTTASGDIRTFKFGSRATNTVDQWPTPDVYTHSSGQQLSSSEVRNINRAYPGSPTGTYTEQVAYAVTNFVNIKDITMVVDMHEASPEYVTINAVVAHNDSMTIAEYAANWNMDLYTATTKDGKIINGVSIGYEQSPLGLRGLTHRELGDFSNAYVFLLETSNASQGKYRGKFTQDLITYAEKDKFYEFAASKGLLYAAPVSIDERVARHTLSITALIDGFNQMGCMTRTVSVTELGGQPQVGEYIGQFVLNNVPEYVDILDNGVGYYLLDSTR